jgi:hypothetical protein
MYFSERDFPMEIIKKINQMKNKVSTYKKTLKHPFLNLGAFALEIQEDWLIKTKVITQKTLSYRQTTTDP